MRKERKEGAIGCWVLRSAINRFCQEPIRLILPTSDDDIVGPNQPWLCVFHITVAIVKVMPVRKRGHFTRTLDPGSNVTRCPTMKI